jgi:hypothetical protein
MRTGPVKLEALDCIPHILWVFFGNDERGNRNEPPSRILACSFWPPPNNGVAAQFRSSPKLNGRPLQSRTVVEFAGAPRLELTDQNSSPDGGIDGISFFFMERVFDPSFLSFIIPDRVSRCRVKLEARSCTLILTSRFLMLTTREGSL